ncbi:hypothetical protein SDC9_191326 [bioreactor metagenome]|uniref:CBM3 domain-containing protein n=1 Tax=bioreactor metagenome TaxID=1076179 RepID=A0A645HYV6_9ZZZZ
MGTSVVEVKFADSTEVLKVGETLEIHFRVHPSNWAAYDLSNDYSQGSSDYQATDKILLYYQNKLACGEYTAD